MLINTKINKDYISLDRINLDFRNMGIYVISGENGVGKSSIIKQLVFENNSISFVFEKQEDAYENERSSLIGYVEQNPQPYNCSVKEYILKYCIKKFSLYNFRRTYK